MTASALTFLCLELIKNKKTPRFDDVAAADLSLWRVNHPVIAANKQNPVLMSAIDAPTEVDPTDDISDVFCRGAPPKKTIHIIVQRPPVQVHAYVPSHPLTPLLGHRSDGSRPGTPLSDCGKTHAVIELPSQHQGFYFNTADNDWGSADMMTLYNTICGYLKDVQNSLTADDPETNNYYPAPQMMSLLH
ncbi:hypothetical protein BGW42_006188 [Actinomortierella wolfii]|nr:hypothetical protein BGW42_006188 [Actinomortierella wolfii]